MKKRWIALAGMAALVIGAFAACGNEADIGRDKALETALEDAGVTEENATRLQVSEDRDDGRKVYDVRFDVEDTAYDYEIQASDGTILSSETERISGNATRSGDDGTSQNTAETQNQSQTTQGQSRVETELQLLLPSARSRRCRSRWSGCPERRRTISGWNLITMTVTIGTREISSTSRESTISRLTPTRETFWSGVKRGIEDKKREGAA